jgi:hypothetical protein
MSVYHNYLNVGRSPSKLDHGITQHPLDWRRLQGLSPKERESEIIKRANLYTFEWAGYLWKLGIYGPAIWRVRDKAKEEGKYSKVRENIAVPKLE